MTLDTRIYILDPVDVQQLFREGQRLLGLADERRRGPEQQAWDDRQDKTWRSGKSYVESGNPWTISNDCGQNLPGWLMIHYRRDGERLRTPADAAMHEYCNHPDSEFHDPDEPTCIETEHEPACWAEVSIDTAYGYRGPDGYGCGDLHAAFAAALGEWLDARSVRWKWKNEFTGEIHEGYDQLIDLASGGFEAAAWFRTTVLPAIASGGAL